MAIPINPLSDRSIKYNSVVDFYGVRSSFAIPRKIILTLTNRCNLRCNMCTLNNSSITEEEMKTEEWVRIIEEIAWTKPVFLLFGGEPLLFSDIPLIVAKIREWNCPIEIVTNGFFLAEHIDTLMDAHAGITISMSGTAEIHNFIKNNRQSFGKIVNVLEYIAQVNPEYFKKVCVNCVITPDNIDGIDEFISFMSEYPIDTLCLQHMQFSTESLKDMTDQFWQKYIHKEFSLVLKPNKDYSYDSLYLKKIKILQDAIKDKKYKSNITFFPNLNATEIDMYYSESSHFLLKKDNVCLKPWRTPTICPNGDVSNCAGMIIGNVRNESFWSIWNGEKNQAFRMALMKYEMFPFCTRCCSFYERYEFSKIKRG